MLLGWVGVRLGARSGCRGGQESYRPHCQPLQRHAGGVLGGQDQGIAMGRDEVGGFGQTGVR